MPAGTRNQLSNCIFEQLCYLPAVTPPASVVTAVITTQTLTVRGLLVGDFVGWNIVSPTSTLLSITNMYVSAPDTLIIGWSTEGATVNSAPAQQILLGVLRPENGSMGLSALPANVL
jgi:hypothetical protein